MKALTVILLPILLLLSCASGHREPFSESTPVFRDLVSFERELETLCSGSELLELEEIGGVEYGRFLSPIWVIRYHPPEKRPPIFPWRIVYECTMSLSI